MTAYDPSQWSDLFVATAGASAALAGLVFVAVSINIERILKFPELPKRALETVMLLLLVLLISIMGLIPEQGHVALGLELLAFGLAFGGAIASMPAGEGRGAPDTTLWLFSRWGLRALAIMPLVLGGLTLLIEAGGGLYWVVWGIVFALLGAVGNAWVLLVEILR